VIPRTHSLDAMKTQDRIARTTLVCLALALIPLSVTLAQDPSSAGASRGRQEHETWRRMTTEASTALAAAELTSSQRDALSRLNAMFRAQSFQARLDFSQGRGPWSAVEPFERDRRARIVDLLSVKQKALFARALAAADSARLTADSTRQPASPSR
jgi:hypothetical protein